ncbi:MAG: Fpg/Nei family DNA glycosylase [Actinobacteria bacterium]|nr:Fpg/Nei family DNA glycosylase [Actinomycetota bacterium]
MPEGDTVWLAAKRLDDALGGQALVSSDFRLPALATVDLAGVTILGVAPRGKHLLFRLDDGRTLHTHFRMEGAWHLYRPDARWRGGPAHTVRVVLTTAAWSAVGYRIPVVDLIATADEGSVVGHLGPDLLGPDWDAGAAVDRLQARPDMEIGEALLDQRNLAGIGAIYCCESLFLCGVSPFTPVGQVPDLSGLVTTAHRLLMRNAPRTSRSTTGDERRPYYVYSRRRQPCRRCGTLIESGEQGRAPRARVMYWCPRCQARGA